MVNINLEFISKLRVMSDKLGGRLQKVNVIYPSKFVIPNFLACIFMIYSFTAIGLTGANETAHLHKLGDFAVALCRTPDHTLLIFSLPQCQLIHQTKLCVIGSIERPLETDDLDQRFLMRNNTMMFMFHHPQFFFDEDDNIIMQPNQNQHNQNNVKRYGRLVFVDFTRFLTLQANKKTASTSMQSKKQLKNNCISNNESGNSSDPLISMSMDTQFDCNDDYIEKISVISKDRMVCVMSSGKILLRDIVRPNGHNPTICSHIDKLSIPCPQGLKLPGGSHSDDMGGYDTDDNEDEGNAEFFFGV